MDVYKLFSFLIYSSILLNLKGVWAAGEEDNGSTEEGGSVRGSQPTSSGGTEEAQDSGSSQTPATPVPENPLNFNELKEEYGLFKEVTLDNFKFTFFRSFVGKSFNKFKMGDLDLWPDNVTKESVFEFHMINSGNKYLLTLTSIKKEGYLNHTYLFIEPDSSDQNKLTKKVLDRANVLDKFTQWVYPSFKPPYPDGLVKDPLFQDWYAHYNKTLDNNVPDNLDVL